MNTIFPKNEGSTNLTSKPKRHKYWSGKESSDLNYPDTITTERLLKKFDIMYDSIYDRSEYDQTYYRINKLLPFAHRVAEKTHFKIMHQIEESADDTIAYYLAEVVGEIGWRNTELLKKIPFYDHDELIEELKKQKPNHSNKEYEFAIDLALFNLGGMALLNMGVDGNSGWAIR